VAEQDGVTVAAVHLGILGTEEGGGIQVAVALVAAEAVLVEEAMLGWDLLCLEHTALAPNACIGRIVSFRRNGSLVAVVVLPAGAMVTKVADAAVDLHDKHLVHVVNILW